MAAMARNAPPRGVLRWFLRMPIWLYRLGLGGLLGLRFLLLTHRGRRSGLWHDTVVEVVTRDDDGSAWYICSGWGRTSNWFQNIQKFPEVRFQVGNRRFNALAQALPHDDAETVLGRYAHAHPVAFQKLYQVMLGEKAAGLDEGCRKLAAAVPVVRLKVK
jgi:deazaflavin-dependent oxidoreductase (nitroreductase family)